MKKDFKALKKHKETEIKRISKELKSREEELETTKHTLQLKEVALEGVRAIAQEQTAKIKALEEQLEEMKSALSEVQKNEECKTWLVHCTCSGHFVYGLIPLYYSCVMSRAGMVRPPKGIRSLLI